MCSFPTVLLLHIYLRPSPKRNSNIKKDPERALPITVEMLAYLLSDENVAVEKRAIQGAGSTYTTQRKHIHTHTFAHSHPLVIEFPGPCFQC